MKAADESTSTVNGRRADVADPASAAVPPAARMAIAPIDPADPSLDPAVHARRWLILPTLCVSMVIIVIDNTILNVAVPSFINELGASTGEVQWILDSYILVFASLLLTTGTLSDRFGRKGALQIGIVWFLLGSTAAALSTSATQLIAARAFMGIGGALIMPSTLSILTNVFRDPRERARAIAIWAGVSGLGVALGPTVGGLLLRHFEWNSVFWVNLPIGGAALVAGAFLLPKSRDPDPGKLDPLGVVLSIVGLVAVVYAVISGPERGWSDTNVVVAFAVGFIALIAFVIWELNSSNPMLPMSFFKNPRFSAANAALTVMFFALMGSLFLMTQYWQLVQGYTPLQAGIRVLPQALTMMAVAPMSARFVEWFGTKRVVVTGLLFVAGSLGALSLIQAHTDYWKVILIISLMSAGMGMTTAPATESVMGSLPRDKAGIGSAMNNTTRQVGGALGIAIIGSIVTSVYTNRIDSLSGRFSLSASQLDDAKESIGGALDVADDLGANALVFSEAARVGFVEAFHSGLRVSAVIIVIAAFIAWKYLPARGDDLDGDPVLAHASSMETVAGVGGGG